MSNLSVSPESGHSIEELDLQAFDEDRTGTSWWRVLLFVASAWLAVSVLLAFVLAAQEGVNFVWAFSSSGWQCLGLVAVAIPTWFVLKASQGLRLPARLAVVLALVAVSVPAWELMFEQVLRLTAGEGVVSIRRDSSGYWRWLQALIMYAVVVAGMALVLASRRLRAEERRSAELQLLMRESELRALRAQLRPHFLFNTLNSIYSLIPERPHEAATMVAMLSELMQETLELTDQTLVPLEIELRLAERYLGVEAVRLGERLSVKVEADQNSLAALVPPFLLQPIVENAVHHGIAPYGEPGTIMVKARLVTADGPQRLRLDVVDDGGGLGASLEGINAPKAKLDKMSRGHGLRITRSRLKNQYGESFEMELGSSESEQNERGGKGCTVSIEIPFVTSDVSTSQVSNELGETTALSSDSGLRGA